MALIEFLMAIVLGFLLGCGFMQLSKAASPFTFEEMMRDEEQEEFIKKLNDEREE